MCCQTKALLQTIVPGGYSEFDMEREPLTSAVTMATSGDVTPVYGAVSETRRHVTPKPHRPVVKQNSCPEHRGHVSHLLVPGTHQVTPQSRHRQRAVSPHNLFFRPDDNILSLAADGAQPNESLPRDTDHSPSPRHAASTNEKKPRGQFLKSASTSWSTLSRTAPAHLQQSCITKSEAQGVPETQSVSSPVSSNVSVCGTSDRSLRVSSPGVNSDISEPSLQKYVKSLYPTFDVLHNTVLTMEGTSGKRPKVVFKNSVKGSPSEAKAQEIPSNGQQDVDNRNRSQVCLTIEDVNVDDSGLKTLTPTQETIDQSIIRGPTGQIKRCVSLQQTNLGHFNHVSSGPVSRGHQLVQRSRSLNVPNSNVPRSNVPSTNVPSVHQVNSTRHKSNSKQKQTCPSSPLTTDIGMCHVTSEETGTACLDTDDTIGNEELKTFSSYDDLKRIRNTPGNKSHLCRSVPSLRQNTLSHTALQVTHLSALPGEREPKHRPVASRTPSNPSYTTHTTTCPASNLPYMTHTTTCPAPTAPLVRQARLSSADDIPPQASLSPGGRSTSRTSFVFDKIPSHSQDKSRNDNETDPLLLDERDPTTDNDCLEKESLV